MRAKLAMYIAFGLVAAVALVIGIAAVAGADQANPLPAVSAPDLLAKMAQQDQQTTSISGDVSWQNDLLGDLSALTGSATGAAAKLPLAATGSGRIWMSAGGARVESQAGGGDQTVVANAGAHEVWLYDYAANTARHIVMKGTPPEGAEPTPTTPAMANPEAISSFLQRVAPYADVQVTGQGVVAGRDVYFLTMTPTAPDTALGAVQASIDGRTFVPLQLQVTAKGDPSPVLQFGFTTVSYDAVPASTFDFTPPAGTDVTTKTVDLSEAAMEHKGLADGQKAEPSKAQREQMQSLMRSALLTVPEAQKLVPFRLASANGYTARPFAWAAVVSDNGPLNALDQPVMQLLGATGMSGFGGASDGSAATSTSTGPAGPTAVLLYGKGFGTIALAQTATTPELDKQLRQLPAQIDTATINGAKVRSLTTPLGGVYIWQQGDTTLMAGGMVPRADLEAFVTSVR